MYVPISGFTRTYTLTLYLAVHAVLLMLVLANIPMAIYFSLFHQRGSTAVMHYLRNVRGKLCDVLPKSVYFIKKKIFF